jgi:predicted unusual protein kinase regulating ubiquinone biosynthesis (AarF/ABC1/UbiB family)
VEGDTRVIEIFIEMGERMFPGFKYRWLGEEIRANLPKELDFKLEVQNILRCKE